METAVAIKIKAWADKIMALLTNVANFKSWNSTVIPADGQIRQGEKINLFQNSTQEELLTLKFHS